MILPHIIAGKGAMLIVKPYGKSFTNPQERQILKHSVDGQPSEAEGFSTFVTNEPKLVIAQWISVIDKIITKPKGDTKATDEQDEWRKALGAAAWAVIKSEQCLGANADYSDTGTYKKYGIGRLRLIRIIRGGLQIRPKQKAVGMALLLALVSSLMQ